MTHDDLSIRSMRAIVVGTGLAVALIVTALVTGGSDPAPAPAPSTPATVTTAPTTSTTVVAFECVDRGGYIIRTGPAEAAKFGDCTRTEEHP